MKLLEVVTPLSIYHILRAEEICYGDLYHSYGRECTDVGTNIQLPRPTHMTCYYGHPKKLGTSKDERNNWVTAQNPEEKAKVSCLHNRVDVADVEDAADTEQNAKTKIIKKKCRDVTRFYKEG